MSDHVDLDGHKGIGMRLVLTCTLQVDDFANQKYPLLLMSSLKGNAVFQEDACKPAEDQIQDLLNIQQCLRFLQNALPAYSSASKVISQCLTCPIRCATAELASSGTDLQSMKEQW